MTKKNFKKCFTFKELCDYFDPDNKYFFSSAKSEDIQNVIVNTYNSKRKKI